MLARTPAFLTAAAVLFAAAPQSALAQTFRPNIAAEVPVRADVRDLGIAQQSQMVSLALTLHYRHEAELERLVDAQSDPMSAYYGKFLNNQQFNAYFAPSPSADSE